jgi:methylglutaconyl-CoA hydratase
MTDPIATPFTDLVFPTGEVEGSSVVIEATPAGVAVVNLNRPGRKNAFDSEMIGALTEAFTTLKASEHVRTVFVRGVGGAFCAGADLAWMRDASDFTESQNREDALELAHMLKALWDLPQLTVALVQGPAFGGGAGLACACDLALATPEAVFSFSEVKLGLIPAVISPYVVEALGARAARRLFATGERFGAQAAARLGLVERVVESEDALHQAARDIAHAQAACAPGAVAESKRLVAEVAGKPIDRGVIEHTAKRIAAQRVSPEGREGVAAFLERRKPSWIG